MPKVEAYITPEVIHWARERAEKSPRLSKIVRKLHNQIIPWERGITRPTIRQAQELAQTLSIPFGYLFLSNPPEEQLPLADFRVIGGEAIKEPDVDVITLVNAVLEKQAWFHDFRLSEEVDPLPFVGRFSTTSSANIVAEDIQTTLQVNDHLRENSASLRDFLRQIMTTLEAIGVLVMRSGIVGANTRRVLSVEDFRGFAISDALAPLVFINGVDALAAQIFTIIHETAHVWIGATGISNRDPGRSPHPDNLTEKFCDHVAAEVLVPEASFMRLWSGNHTVDENLARLTGYFHVSSVVILRRARDLGKITSDQYHTLYVREEKKASMKTSAKGGGNYYLNVMARNGRTFTTTLIGAAIDGKTPLREAAHFLDIKVPMIFTMAKYLSDESRRKQ